MTVDASQTVWGSTSIAWPAITVLLLAGLAASVGLAETVYGVSANVILDSACRAITAWDIVTSCIKAWVFGTIISVVSRQCICCAW